jgi:hypothetical protein
VVEVQALPRDGHAKRLDGAMTISFIHWWRSKPRSPLATQSDLEKSTQTIMAKISELSAIVAGLTAQVNKAKVEIVERIAALESALQDVELPSDAENALAELKASVQAVDDINPDATP